MKQKIYLILAVAILITACQNAKIKNQKQNKISPDLKFEFIDHKADQRVDVMIDGQLFTSYWWPDTVYKPILYPLLSAAGTPITRGFPIKPREGERRDHIHQVGNWFNYGNVNGYDFWGNGSTGKRNYINGGQIKHLGISNLHGGNGEGSMVATASWIDPAGKELLAEKTEFHFIAKDSVRIIDRIATLTATGEEVVFKDTKEGSFGIRVARQLELLQQDNVYLTDAEGNQSKEKTNSTEAVSGNYRSSEKIFGEKVWGTRAKWMDLYGNIGEEKISLVICDHPKNLNYPTYWHARGYGLFAANPFGVKDFTSGKEELNYVIPVGKSLTQRYRIIICSGKHLTDAEIEGYSNDFAEIY